MNLRRGWPLLFLFAVLSCFVVYAWLPGLTGSFEKHKPGDPPIFHHHMVRLADSLALRGSQSLADGRMMASRFHYSLAIILLPFHELTEERRKAYTKQFERTW